MPEFSVLLPVYAGDDADHFAQSLRSVTVDQELPPTELVIVRDGPVSPAIEDVILRAEAGENTGGIRAHVVRLEENVGLARALEAGLAATSHEIVARADADDISVPSRFRLQLALMEQGYELVGSAITEFETDPAEGGATRCMPTGSEDIADVARFRDPFNHPSVVYTKSAVLRSGGYEDLAKMEDYWLFARMIQDGARTANLPDSLVRYRVGAGAYKRRGGVEMLRSEIDLQRRMARRGFVTLGQAARNIAVRGGYRLIPTFVREGLYRRFVLGRR